MFSASQRTPYDDIRPQTCDCLDAVIVQMKSRFTEELFSRRITLLVCHRYSFVTVTDLTMNSAHSVASTIIQLLENSTDFKAHIKELQT